MIELREGVPGEYSKTFLQGMIDRMAVSYHKYGAVKDGFADGAVDAMKSLEDRLQLYKETGNTEWLMDAANFAMIEFMFPQHPEANYRPTDSSESPGRVRHDGAKIGAQHNLDTKSPK